MKPEASVRHRVRIDTLLVERGLALSRGKAQAAILAGLVRAAGARIEKPGVMVAADAEILVQEKKRFVGRGGEKLDGILKALRVDILGASALDVGASTGGFTDCLLKAGASSVVALDVGRGQLDWKLRCDPRVTVLERVNARYLDPGAVPYPFDLIVVDVSFISLTLVLPALFPLLRETALRTAASSSSPRGAAGEALSSRPPALDSSQPLSPASPPARLPALLALVKPQFEVGRGEVGRRGVVRDPEKQIQAILKVAACGRACTLAPPGAAVTRGSRPSRPGLFRILESPLRGAEGNREFFLCFRRGRGLAGNTLGEEIRRVVRGAAPGQDCLDRVD